MPAPATTCLLVAAVLIGGVPGIVLAVALAALELALPLAAE